LPSNYWVKNYGGYETLKSYGVFSLKKNNSDVLKEHIQWIKNLPLYLEYPDIKNKDGRSLVVSHSSINDKWKFKDSTSEIDKDIFKTQLLFSRDVLIHENKEIYNIFGHTPIEKVDLSLGYANIDTGCVYSDGDMFGTLSAIEFPAMKVITQVNID
jgi:serine/threonine protein phosphatase 1